MAVGRALAWVVIFRRIYVILLIIFIESATARKKEPPIFFSDTIYMCMFISIVYWALVNGGIVIAFK